MSPNLPNRNYIPRSPSGSNNEARRFADTHDLLHPARRPMPPPNPQFPTVAQLAVMFPFKIYPITNASATDEQRDAYTAAGFDISNYTYQIRSGLLGYRSQYFFTIGSAFGTFEKSIFCDCTDSTTNVFESQPEANTGVSVLLSNVADTLIYDPSLGILQPLPQIALDPTLDDLGLNYASFWLKVIDDPFFGVYTQLWGRMFTINPIDSTGRPTTALPSDVDSSIIPLGYVFTPIQDSPAFGVSQYQSGNLVNRYAALAPLSSPLGPVNIQRGYWDADSLAGQVFYKGDIVVDDTVPVLSAATSDFSGNLYGVYTWEGIFPDSPIEILTDPPSVYSSGWRMTGTVYSNAPL